MNEQQEKAGKMDTFCQKCISSMNVFAAGKETHETKKRVMLFIRNDA